MIEIANNIIISVSGNAIKKSNANELLFIHHTLITDFHGMSWIKRKLLKFIFRKQWGIFQEGPCGTAIFIEDIPEVKDVKLEGNQEN